MSAMKTSATLFNDFFGEWQPLLQTLTSFKIFGFFSRWKSLTKDGFLGRNHILIPSHLWLLLPASKRELTCI